MMKRFTEPACGKCDRCGDQLLSIPGRNHEDSRRIVCPICVTNNLEDLTMRMKLQMEQATPASTDTVILSREEIERCSE